jgi:hypothetical protein
MTDDEKQSAVTPALQPLLKFLARAAVEQFADEQRQPELAANDNVAALLAEIERVQGIRDLYKRYGAATGKDVRRALFDIKEALICAEMAVEGGNPARIMDSLRELRSYEP